jgi:hypothetical protein
MFNRFFFLTCFLFSCFCSHLVSCQSAGWEAEQYVRVESILTASEEGYVFALQEEADEHAFKAFLLFLVILPALILTLRKAWKDEEVRERRRKVRVDEEAGWKYAFKKKLKDTELAKKRLAKEAEQERSWKAREDWLRRKQERRKAYHQAIEAKKEKAREPGRLREERKRRRREELEGKQ